jgi:prepilin-type N-terminal cleavage/methylation domain-containing protein
MCAARREAGFTLIEILVVITIIAALSGLVVAVVPIAIEKSKETACLNNLLQIGGILSGLKSSGELQQYSGAAFVLQAAEFVKDDDLSMFVCPGEAVNPDDPRPDVKGDRFINLFREEMDLTAGKVEDRMCSYAGPNLRKFPPAKVGRDSQRTRLWACDKCRNGHAHHDGIAVLHESSKVEILRMRDLKGHDDGENRILVGPNSPDSRLMVMSFFPLQ